MGGGKNPQSIEREIVIAEGEIDSSLGNIREEMKDQLRVSPLPPKELGKLLAEIRQIAYEKTMAAIDKHNSEQEIAARAAESAPQEVDNAGAEVAEAAAAVMGQKSSSSEKGYYLHLKGK